ncbi:MAG TPA: signal recognition particle-docking protein FtsY [Methyloceanibacter sp.]|jgi:fused signal recognition particle receptor|nr:signal recognition particle-docking protein FtsY [Methyloceanibacter sp.]
MSDGKKPGFFKRFFGIGGDTPKPAEAPPPAKKEPPSGTPKRKPPTESPARKEPPKDKPAKKEPPKKRSPKKAQPKGPPPAGPATVPGALPPEERPPGSREKESPAEKAAPSVFTPAAPDKPAPKTEPQVKPAPPPGGPAAHPGKASPEELPPGERKKDKPNASAMVEPRRGWFDQLRKGLARTSSALSDNLAGALTKRKFDEETLDRLEEVLIKADLGVAMAARIRARVGSGRYDRGLDPDRVRDILAAEIASVLEPLTRDFALTAGARPHVFLIVGVNGTGKTTTIGKMAHLFRRRGLNVMLAAADTFRAAAIDQLKVWGERVGAEVVAKQAGADPAGVAFEAFERARAEGTDVLLIDTAGRLQNKSDLMAELAKIVRVLKKLDERAPHGVILVLDATTGQNALNQVEIFKEIAGVTGIVVTKLDGTARGGILVAIAERFGLPLNAIGIGEGIEDLKPFEARDFARAIAGAKSENEAAA